MNTTAELTMYQEALRAEGTAILRWDLNADRVYGDELLQGVIPEKLKNESYSAFLLQSLPEKVIEYRVKEDSGEYRWYHARYIIHFAKERAQYATILLRNTDSEHRHTEALQQKAQRDALTGLYNKEYAKELIKEALGVPGTVKALLVLDMDGFKKINDNLGHLFGDAVISDMALTLAEVFDETDIIGRVGGDEFVVLIRDAADRSLVVKRCEKLRNMLRRSFAYGDGKELHVSGSVGIAMSPEYGRRYEELFGFADAALYEAKRRGRIPRYSSSKCFTKPATHGSQSKRCLPCLPSTLWYSGSLSTSRNADSGSAGLNGMPTGTVPQRKPMPAQSLNILIPISKKRFTVLFPNVRIPR